jgi:HPt (histidine-containing phosphotransfer) domain-containing protein
MGATRLVTICEELEAAGRSGKLENAVVLAEHLEAEYGRVRTALEKELTRS